MLSGCLSMMGVMQDEIEYRGQVIEELQQELAAANVDAAAPVPTNVILIVGDGMGVPQVYASVVAERDSNSAFLRFPYSGFSRTYSRNKYRTDSSAGGTALMTGHKVDNYHVNWDNSPLNSKLILGR